MCFINKIKPKIYEYWKTWFRLSKLAVFWTNPFCILFWRNFYVVNLFHKMYVYHRQGNWHMCIVSDLWPLWQPTLRTTDPAFPPIYFHEILSTQSKVITNSKLLQLSRKSDFTTCSVWAPFRLKQTPIIVGKYFYHILTWFIWILTNE